MRFVLIASFAVALLASGCTTSGVTRERATGSEQPGTQVSGRSSEDDAKRRARVRLELASNYYQQGRLPVALEEVRLALRADPGYVDAYNLLGLIEMNLNDRVEAEAAFKRALQLAPNDAEVQSNYGWFLCQTGRVSESFEHFQIALRNPLYRAPAVTLRSAGICALRSGDAGLAIDYLSRAYEYEPNNGATQYNLALALYQRKEYERAQTYIGKLNREIEVSAETLWLEIKTEHKLGHRNAVGLLGTQLSSRYPESREAGAYRRGAFDE